MALDAGAQELLDQVIGYDQYLPGPHRGVWNERGLTFQQSGQAEVIFTEALIDAMTFWCAGYRNVAAAYGVEGLTDDHLAAFKRCGVRRVLIAFDRDDAGERGAEKAAERLMAEGLECYRIQFPTGSIATPCSVKAQGAVRGPPRSEVAPLVRIPIGWR